MNKRLHYFVYGELSATCIDAETVFGVIKRFVAGKDNVINKKKHDEVLEDLADWLKSNPRPGSSHELEVGNPTLVVEYKYNEPYKPVYKK